MTAPGPRNGPRAGAGKVSRADALRAYFELGADRVAEPARCLGFTWLGLEPPAPAPVAEVEVAEPEAPSPARTPVVTDVADAGEPLAPVPFWRPVEVTRSEAEEGDDPSRAPEAEQRMKGADLRSSGPPPPTPPIVAEPRLRRRLDAELRTPRPSQAVDVDVLVDRVARGESVREIPRRVGLTQARLVLILDPSPRLVPFWEDQLTLALALIHRLGARRIRRLPPPDATGGTDGAVDVAADEIVLAVTDLGFYGREGDRERWLRFGRRLRAAGAELRALVPCPAWRWRGPGARLWRAIDWSSPEGPGKRLPPRPLRGAPVGDPVEALLRLLAPAVRVEPGLLRTVRRLLGEGADLGTEADAWNHPEVDGASSRTLEIDPRRRLATTWEALGEATGWDPELVSAAARAVVDWHRERADLVWAIEVAHLLACGVPEAAFKAERVAEAEQILARAAASAASTDEAKPRLAEAGKAFWRREMERAPARMSTHRRFGPTLARAVRTLRAVDRDAPLPAGVTPEMLADPGSKLPIRRFEVRQHGDRLRVGRKGSKVAGSLVVEVSAREPVLTVSDGLQPSVPVDLGDELAELPCPALETPVELVTDVESVRAEPRFRPSWASRAGRDGYGLWAAFEVEGVEHRLRWVPPGRFLMGSPEGEEGRWEDEGPRHEVTLTEGFWLGEVPCTQAFWEVVMGKNPSRFQTPNRPVEQISWEDCQEFFERLDERVPGFAGRLPTEAQWEHACRAGTETATWVGDLEILGERKAPILDEIAWYGGNSGVDFDLAEEGYDSSSWPEKQYPHTRAGTREVGLKRPNPWGIYDMLGNVWEWCSDRWQFLEGYEGKDRVDPEGDRGTYRVFRGGSWFVHARGVRAAYRSGLGPGDRDDDLGFRLSRGPQE